MMSPFGSSVSLYQVRSSSTSACGNVGAVVDHDAAVLEVVRGLHERDRLVVGAPDRGLAVVRPARRRRWSSTSASSSSVGTSEWSDLFGSAGKLCSVQPASSSAARSPPSPPPREEDDREHDRERRDPRACDQVEHAPLLRRLRRIGRRRAPLRSLRALGRVRGAVFPGHRRADRTDSSDVRCRPTRSLPFVGHGHLPRSHPRSRARRACAVGRLAQPSIACARPSSAARSPSCDEHARSTIEVETLRPLSSEELSGRVGVPGDRRFEGLDGRLLTPQKSRWRDGDADAEKLDRVEQGIRASLERANDLKRLEQALPEPREGAATPSAVAWASCCCATSSRRTCCRTRLPGAGFDASDDGSSCARPRRARRREAASRSTRSSRWRAYHRRAASAEDDEQRLLAQRCRATRAKCATMSEADRDQVHTAAVEGDVRLRVHVPTRRVGLLRDRLRRARGELQRVRARTPGLLVSPTTFHAYLTMIVFG